MKLRIKSSNFQGVLGERSQEKRASSCWNDGTRQDFHNLTNDLTNDLTNYLTNYLTNDLAILGSKVILKCADQRLIFGLHEIFTLLTDRIPNDYLTNADR